jgi:hypothetical protein
MLHNPLDVRAIQRTGSLLGDDIVGVRAMVDEAMPARAQAPATGHLNQERSGRLAAWLSPPQTAPRGGSEQG